MKILVVGGAGYIGFITALELKQAGHDVVIFDHFQTHTPDKIGAFKYISGDITISDDIKSALGL